MKKPTQPVRLKLKHETVKTLATAELAGIAGAAGPTTGVVETFHTLERSCVDC
jgi:hypothetical protein